MNLLIVGATSELSLEIINSLPNSQISKIIITSSHIERLKDLSNKFIKLEFNLFDDPKQFCNSEFYNYIKSNDELDCIYYLAHVNSTTRIKESTSNEMYNMVNVIANNILALKCLSEKLKYGGKLLVAGAIGSERHNSRDAIKMPKFHNLHYLKIGNTNGSSLHCLVKGHLRDLVCCLTQEYLEKYIYYINLGPFQKQSNNQTILPTKYIAHRLIDLMFYVPIKDVPNSFNLTLCSNDYWQCIKYLRLNNYNCVESEIIPLLETTKKILHYRTTQLPGTIMHKDSIIQIYRYADLDQNIRKEIEQLMNTHEIDLSQIARSEHGDLIVSLDDIKSREFMKIFGKVFSLVTSTTISSNKNKGETLHPIKQLELIEKCNRFMQHIIDNTQLLIKILSTYECYNVIVDEIYRSLDYLINIEQVSSYFQFIVGDLGVFLPRNQPLYSLLNFAIIPSLMSSNCHVRPSTELQKVFQELETVLEIKKFFPNIVFHLNDKFEYLKELKNTKIDGIIFTGKPSSLQTIRNHLNKKEILYILNGSGHNPVLIDEAANIKLAVNAVIQLTLYNQGQDCAAPNTILVHKTMKEDFVKKICKKLEKIKSKIGSFSDFKNVVGPNSDMQTLCFISKFFLKYRKWCIYGGDINFFTGLISPTVFDYPLNLGANFEEFFAPIINIQSFENYNELENYFFSSKYLEHSMYLMIYGGTNTTQKLIEQLIQKNIHSIENILLNNNVHEVERGFLPYGGLGKSGSCIFFENSQIAGSTLPPRDLFFYLIKKSDKKSDEKHEKMKIIEKYNPGKSMERFFNNVILINQI